MKQHKWHKEIKAWADGAEIEVSISGEWDWSDWIADTNPEWETVDYQYRIKPQPKEPQYLYVWFEPNYGKSYLTANISVNGIPAGYEYLGKIKLEVDDD